MSFLNRDQIGRIGFKMVGVDVKISNKASFYNPQNISIGDYSRIDDFSVLSAGSSGIEIGRNVHISVGVTILGGGKVVICDFAGLSAKTSIFSSNDDYSGEYMTNPTVDPKFTHVVSADIYIGKHVVIGAGCVILPNVRINDGVSIGSLSLIKSDCDSFGIYVGIPAKKIKERSNRLLTLEKEFILSG